MMAEANPEPSHPLLERLFERLAAKDGVHFKLQTRDEPDLTTSEKVAIAREIHLKSPGRFLARFHQHLQPDDTVCFAACADDYEVAFYLRQIADRNVARVQRNRRFTAMGRLMKEGDYFSETAMRERDPELYEELVGRFDDAPPPTPGYRSFSEFLLSSLDSRGNRRCVPELMETEDEDVEEFDTDDDEDEGTKMTESCSEEEDKEDAEVDKADEKEEKGDEEEEEDENARAATEEAQRALYRQEFLSVMKERFMRGEDKDFDYDALNADLSLDDQEENDRDLEERYFDEEEPQTPRTSSSLSSYDARLPRTPPGARTEPTILNGEAPDE